MSALPAPANRLIDNPGSRRAAPEEIRNRFITAGRAFKRNPKHVNAAVLRRQECHLPGFLPGKSLKSGIVCIRILFFIFPPSFDGIRSVKRRSASQIILEAPGERQAHFHVAVGHHSSSEAGQSSRLRVTGVYSQKARIQAAGRHDGSVQRHPVRGLTEGTYTRAQCPGQPCGNEGKDDESHGSFVNIYHIIP